MDKIYSKEETKELCTKNQHKEAWASIVYYAEQDDPFFLNVLGFLYQSKKEGIPLDYEKSVYYEKRAADLNYPLAFYNLGLAYRDGKGVEKNRDMCVKYMEKAASLEVPGAYAALACIYVFDDKRRNLEKAYTCALSGWEKNGICACVLASFYSGGFGDSIVKQDISKAEKYYLHSISKQPTPNAYAELADLIIKHPSCVRSTYEDALNYYLKAMNFGDFYAKVQYAFQLTQGRIFGKDHFPKIKEGLQLLKDSSSESSLACFYLGEIYAGYETCELREAIDKNLAYEYYKKGAKINNHSGCLFRLGTLISYGIGEYGTNMELAMLYIVKAYDVAKNENSKNYINQWRNTDFRQGQYLRKFLNEMNFNQRQELYKKQTYGGAI